MFYDYMPVTTAITEANTDTGTMMAQTSQGQGLKVREMTDAEGESRSIIEGYAATTHVDKKQDKFTEQALRNMAEKIREDSESTIDAVFPEIDGMDESQIGNVNHNNNPAAERLIGAGDTRIVPVFKTAHAEVRTLPDNEKAMFIRGEMLPLPDNVEDAIKGQIEEGALHSFSIEFAAKNVEFDVMNGEPVRRIIDAEPQGNAMTGRPMNDNAEVTNAEMKNMLAEEVEETEDFKNNFKTEESNMSEEEEEVQSEQEEEEVNEPEEEVNEAEEEVEDSGAEEDSELKSDVKELKSMFRDLKEENENLKEENEELKAKLEDAETVGEIKSEISEIKSELESSDTDLEGERPVKNDGEDGRQVKSGSGKAQWKKEIDQLNLDEQALKSEIGSKGMTRAETIAEQHEVKVEEVIDYVN